MTARLLRLIALPLLPALPVLLAGCDDGGPRGGEPVAKRHSFTAEYSGDAARVCGGAGMRNAGAYDPAHPGVVMFELAHLSGSDPWTNRMIPSDPGPLVVDGDDLGAITVVACAIGVRAHREAAIECEADAADGGTTPYRLAPVDWRLEVREAATAEVIATAEDLPASPLGYCPYKSDPDEFEPGPGDADATLAVVERLLARG